ncbi:MAG TPA: hypothetical protein VFL31_05030 [Nitrospiraceae bacterium]|nr:hypothetical protein [Nitrospiraceae bacterium]
MGVRTTLFQNLCAVTSIAILLTTLLGGQPARSQTNLLRLGETRTIVNRDVGSGSPAAGYRSLAWPPDGRTPAFVKEGTVGLSGERRASRVLGLSMVHLDCGDQSDRTATTDAGDTRSDQRVSLTVPRWQAHCLRPGSGPDVVWSDTSASAIRQEIWTAGFDGSEDARQITNLGESVDCPVWSPTGAKIAFVVQKKLE